MLLQAWIHSDASGAMTLTGGFNALSFGPATLTKSTIILAVYTVVS